MKRYLPLLLITFSAVFVDKADAATCSSISRTNVAANSVLTSTEYNTSLNTAYTAINAFDGGCITAGTLEYDALNTTSFNALLNGVKAGCRVTATDGNTLSVDRCMLAVNGQFVRTTTATTATWGGSGFASEVAATIYYLYAKTGSAGTTLNLLIDTTAPNADGYDASGNRVLALFVNNFSSAIDTVLNSTQGNQFEQNWYVDVNISGANPSLGTGATSSYTQVGDAGLTMSENIDSIQSRIPCSSTNTPSGSTCSSGDEVVGVSFILPVPGAVEACATFGHFFDGQAGADAAATFTLIETPTNATTISAQGNRRVSHRGLDAGAWNSTVPFTLCGTFDFATAGQKVLKLAFEQANNAGSLTSSLVLGDGDTSNGQRDIHWSVKPQAVVTIP